MAGPSATANLRERVPPALKPTLDHVDVTVNKFKARSPMMPMAFLKGDGAGAAFEPDRRDAAAGHQPHPLLRPNSTGRPTKLLFGDRRKGYDPNEKKMIACRARILLRLGRRLFPDRGFFAGAGGVRQP